MHDLTATDKLVGRRAAACPMMGDSRPGAAGQASADKAAGGFLSCPVDRTLDHLRSHLAESVSLEMLASMTGQSRSSFCRWFKAATGVPPHRWLLRVRIDEAMRLLAEQSQSLSDIALAVGFTDQAHFGRTFKKVTGTTPGAWQRSRGARPDSESDSAPCLAPDGAVRIWN